MEKFKINIFFMVLILFQIIINACSLTNKTTINNSIKNNNHSHIDSITFINIPPIMDETDIIKDSILLEEMDSIRHYELSRIRNLVEIFNEINYKKIKKLIYDTFEYIDYDTGINVFDSVEVIFFPKCFVNKTTLSNSKYPSETLRAIELDTLPEIIEGNAQILFLDKSVMFLRIYNKNTYPQSLISRWGYYNNHDSEKINFFIKIEDNFIEGAKHFDEAFLRNDKIQQLYRNYLHFLISGVWWGHTAMNNGQEFVFIQDDIYRTQMLFQRYGDYNDLIFSHDELKDNRLINLLFQIKGSK